MSAALPPRAIGAGVASPQLLLKPITNSAIQTRPGSTSAGGTRSRYRIVLALFTIIALSSAGRWYSASRLWSQESPTAGRLSLDEVVYIVLGDRLVKTGEYSSAGVQALLGVDATRVPPYLQAPLFKHPPVFPFLVGLSRVLFSGQPWAAFMPSLLLGALGLGALYWLAVESPVPTASRWIAVSLLGLSPIHWICSSRIWIETTLCAFVVLALAAQTRAERRQSGWWLMGVFWGCAFLTKYTAFVAWLAALVATLVLHRGERVSPRYWRAQLLAVSLVVPWFILRAWYEGWTVLAIWNSGVQEWRLLAAIVLRPAFLLSMAGLTALLLLWHLAPVGEQRPWNTLLGATIVMLLLLAGSPLRFTLFGQPWAGWYHNALAEWGMSFYVTYRASLEPICLLAFVACLPLRKTSGIFVTQGTWLGLFVFLTAWGNYQSRYALPLIPLEALAVGTLAAQALEAPRTRTEWGATVLTVGWLALSVYRSVWVLKDLGLSYDFFYF
jgi:4-amino-4-deoxy-L-arabinose transferase-like glycosyltransferase